jgi:hypothetical protein
VAASVSSRIRSGRVAFITLMCETQRQVAILIMLIICPVGKYPMAIPRRRAYAKNHELESAQFNRPRRLQSGL